MANIAQGELGSTQRPGKGFPQLIRAFDPHRLRRAGLAVLAVAAFVTSIAATSAAIEGHADAGVVIDAEGRVSGVSPTGFAWRDGIRPGQVVLQLTSAASDDGWVLVTQGPDGPIASRERQVLAALRDTLPFALVGLGAGCMGVAFLRLNRAWVLPSACLALVGGSVPFFLANQGGTGIVLGAAALVPVSGLAYRYRGNPLAAGLLLGAGTVVVVLWAQAFPTGANLDPIEPVRRTFALAGTALLMVDRVIVNRPARLTPFQAFWAVLAIVLVVMGLGLIYFAAFPAPVIAIAIVLGLLAVPALRSLVGRRLELALLADLRQQVAADVAEEERGRLARELHDAPLQELAAVIRRLELVPEARGETAQLQSVADQLRNVAIDLRPPMLDDIGLGAALDFLVEQADSASTPVTIGIVDSTGLERASRPPAQVEFALYRIAREALANALSHAHARHISVGGSIAPGAVELAVIDDGVGVAADDPRRASGRGRLGLASMRRRAQAIGADLSIKGTAKGTHVKVSWRA